MIEKNILSQIIVGLVVTVVGAVIIDKIRTNPFDEPTQHESVSRNVNRSSNSSPREALSQTKSNRMLFLAMPADVYSEFITESLVQQVFEKYDFKILLYEPEQQNILSWIK
ncbi:MAG: element excision factor XisH family protein [Saprospiraceae bacterium]